MNGLMHRRSFLTLLGTSAAVWPFAAGAQQPGTPVVGFLSSGSAVESRNLLAAFRQGLKEAGFEDGRNVIIEYRWADGNLARLPELAADLVFVAGIPVNCRHPAEARAFIDFLAGASAKPVYRAKGMDPGRR